MAPTDPTKIPLEKNIRELLKNTIFAHPDDLKKAVKATTPSSPKKKRVPKE